MKHPNPIHSFGIGTNYPGGFKITIGVIDENGKDWFFYCLCKGDNKRRVVGLKQGTAACDCGLHAIAPVKGVSP